MGLSLWHRFAFGVGSVLTIVGFFGAMIFGSKNRVKSHSIANTLGFGEHGTSFFVFSVVLFALGLVIIHFIPENEEKSRNDK